MNSAVESKRSFETSLRARRLLAAFPFGLSGRVTKADICRSSKGSRSHPEDLL